MAPEILEGQQYGYEADIFAAGVILFIMLAGFPPFQFATKQDWWFQKLQTGRHALFWKAHTRQAFFSEEAKDFINKILEPNPAERITIDQILEHNWFTGAVLSDSELHEELANRKREVSSQKKKEREAVARKNERGAGRARGAKRSEDRSILLDEDSLPVSVPEMDYSGAFHAANAGPVGLDLASLGIGSPRGDGVCPVFDEKNNIECYTTFNTAMAPASFLTMLSDLFTGAGIRYNRVGTFELRATIADQSGGIDFVVRVYVTPEDNPMTVVQFRRLKGDVLEFHALFEEFLTEISDVVFIPDDE
jgi:serine/threonine protein kinase